MCAGAVRPVRTPNCAPPAAAAQHQKVAIWLPMYQNWTGPLRAFFWFWFCCSPFFSISISISISISLSLSLSLSLSVSAGPATAVLLARSLCVLAPSLFAGRM